MSGLFGGGSNLPPGCLVSDIPGNRPEDQMWESIVENFWDKKRIAKHRLNLSTRSKRVMGHIFRRHKFPDMPSQREYALQDCINEYIEMAIEYGMELGERRADNTHMENIGWARASHELYRNPYLRQYFKALRGCRDEAEVLADSGEFQRLFPSHAADLKRVVATTRHVTMED